MLQIELVLVLNLFLLIIYFIWLSPASYLFIQCLVVCEFITGHNWFMTQRGHLIRTIRQ